MIAVQNHYTIRLAKLIDSRRLWEIRNHPHNRQYADQTQTIAFADHQAWFSGKYFNNGLNKCYVLLNKALEVIGYCRFDSDSRQRRFMVSIAVDPSNQGRGLGQKLLSEALSLFISVQHNKFIKISAQIHKKNVVSLKLF